MCVGFLNSHWPPMCTCIALARAWHLAHELHLIFWRCQINIEIIKLINARHAGSATIYLYFQLNSPRSQELQPVFRFYPVAARELVSKSNYMRLHARCISYGPDIDKRDIINNSEWSMDGISCIFFFVRSSWQIAIALLRTDPISEKVKVIRISITHALSLPRTGCLQPNTAINRSKWAPVNGKADGDVNGDSSIASMSTWTVFFTRFAKVHCFKEDFPRNLACYSHQFFGKKICRLRNASHTSLD